MEDRYNTYRGKAYRFISFKGLYNTINKKTLRFTRSDQFNDPLDNSPYLTFSDWDKYESIELLTQRRFNSLSKRLKNIYINSMSKEYKSEDSYLMWAHYGQSHTQVCFEIDFQNVEYRDTPSNVSYHNNLAEERDRIIRKMDTGKYEKGDLGRFVVTNKSKNWSYEKEVRLIVDRGMVGHEDDKFDFISEINYLLVKFDLRNILKVIFGANSKIEDIKKTKLLFRDNNLNPIFEKMYIDPMTLKLRSKVCSMFE